MKKKRKYIDLRHFFFIQIKVTEKFKFKTKLAKRLVQSFNKSKIYDRRE